MSKYKPLEAPGNCETEGMCHRILEDYGDRIAGVEKTLKESLPTIGRITAAMDNISQHLSEIKEQQKALGAKVEGVSGAVNDIKVSISTYDNRLEALEKAKEAADKAKEEADKENKENRRDYKKLVLSVVGAVIGAALIYYLGFNGKKASGKELHQQPIIIPETPGLVSRKAP